MGIYARRGKNGITWYISYYFNNQQIREKVGREADGVTKKSAEKALMSRQGDVVQGRFKLEKAIKPIGFNKFRSYAVGILTVDKRIGVGP